MYDNRREKTLYENYNHGLRTDVANGAQALLRSVLRQDHCPLLCREYFVEDRFSSGYRGIDFSYHACLLHGKLFEFAVAQRATESCNRNLIVQLSS